MKPFIHPDFLLETETAYTLYHQYAKALPIIDYHNHLPPQEIAENRKYENITQVWLAGDHYKWRALRAAGVSEHFITGTASDKEKFLKWAETCPKTMRNPLYHWTQLELNNYFGIEELLTVENAERVYEQTAEMLQSPEFSCRGLLAKMNVEVVGTTDDPLDSLEHHRAFANEGERLNMAPSFRPDKAMAFTNSAGLNEYASALERLTKVSVASLDTYVTALKLRHDFFHKAGGRVSDHGLNFIPFASFSKKEVDDAFAKLLGGDEISALQRAQLQTFMLLEFAKMNHEKGWVQQFHLGPIRNNNTRLLRTVGADVGTDSIGDYPQAETLSKFLDTLDTSDQLAKTILYNVNPADNEVFATMAGNFNDGSVPGKVQWGSAWWFLDQLDGMEKQMNTLSNLGLLSVFVGMLTDSRSFLSFPRHEYFRRLLCNMLGNDVKKGLLPNDVPTLAILVQNVSYYNAKHYFNF